MSEKIGRVYVGVWDENDEHEIWGATNQEVRMDYLVTLSPLPGQSDEVLKRYERTLADLSSEAVARQDLSMSNWLFSMSLTLPEVFNRVLMGLGPDGYNFTVLELATGEGIAFNAKRRCVYEIYSRRA